MIALIVLLSMLAWAVLSVSMPKHGNALLKRQLREAGQRRLRWFGISLLGIGAYALIAEHGWEFGPVYWLGVIMLSALLWVMILTKITVGNPVRHQRAGNTRKQHPLDSTV